jgi:hypothetical protein
MPDSSIITFEELVAVKPSGSSPDGTDADAYATMRQEFEKANGEIIEEAWPPENGAVALTRKTQSHHSDDIRLHHHTAAWLSQSQADVAIVERRLTSLAAKTHDALAGLPRRILLNQIFCELSSFLESINRQNPSHNAVRVRHAKQEINRLERAYAEAATQSAQVNYIEALLIGWLLLMLTGAGIWGIFQVRDVAVTGQLFFAALLAGGLGACVSVLIRMSKGRFSVQREPSRSHTWFLGALRPFIGATFGVVTFFLVTSGMLQITIPVWSEDKEKALAWIFSVAFLSGFAERFATNLFKASEESVLVAAKNTTNNERDKSENTGE